MYLTHVRTHALVPPALACLLRPCCSVAIPRSCADRRWPRHPAAAAGDNAHAMHHTIPYGPHAACDLLLHLILSMADASLSSPMTSYLSGKPNVQQPLPLHHAGACMCMWPTHLRQHGEHLAEMGPMQHALGCVRALRGTAQLRHQPRLL